MSNLRGSLETWLIARWYGGAHVPAWLGALETVYIAVLGLRRRLYSWGVLSTRQVEVPVVIVGNLTVGGTGKTPLVAALAIALRERGWHPGILSRGYRSGRRGATLVPAAASPDQYGDEPVWLSRSSGVPVAIGSHRIDGAKLLSHSGCDVILSDDGLQHWSLARDIEILVIDGLRRFGNGRLLPAGPLREPASRAQRVDLCVVNGGVVGADEIPMQVTASRIVRVGDVAHALNLCSLSGQQVHAVAGIGNPERFFTMLEAAGLVVHRHAWPDHHHFSGNEVQFADELLVLVTEKDAVKVARYAHDRLYAVPIDVQLPAACIDQLQARLCRLRSGAACP